MVNGLIALIIIFLSLDAKASNSLSTVNSFGPGASQVDFTSVETAKTLDAKKWSILGFVDASTPAFRGFLGFQYPFGFSNQVAKIQAAKEEKPKAEKIAEQPVKKKRESAVLPEKLAPPVVSVETIKEETPEPMTVSDVEEQVEEQVEEDMTEDFLESATSNEDPAPVAEQVPVFEEPVVLPAKQALIQSTQEFDSNQDVSELPPEQLNQKIILNNIEFDFDSAEFDSASKVVLGKVLSYLKNNPFKSLEIWGHTDFKGSTSYNENLGLRRAQAVYDLFKKAKVPGSLMNYDAFGERRPVSLGLSEQDRRKNRRVEIIVIRE